VHNERNQYWCWTCIPVLLLIELSLLQVDFMHEHVYSTHEDTLIFVQLASLDSSIPDPKPVESQGDNRKEIGKGADPMEHTEFAVQGFHIIGHPWLVVLLALLLLQPVALEHRLASQWSNDEIIEALAEKDNSQGINLGNIRDIGLSEMFGDSRVGHSPQEHQPR